MVVVADRVQRNEADERTMMRRNREVKARETMMMMMRRLISTTKKRTRRPSLRGVDESERNYYR